MDSNTFLLLDMKENGGIIKFQSSANTTLSNYDATEHSDAISSVDISFDGKQSVYLHGDEMLKLTCCQFPFHRPTFRSIP